MLNFFFLNEKCKSYDIEIELNDDDGYLQQLTSRILPWWSIPGREHGNSQHSGHSIAFVFISSFLFYDLVVGW